MLTETLRIHTCFYNSRHHVFVLLYKHGSGEVETKKSVFPSGGPPADALMHPLFPHHPPPYFVTENRTAPKPFSCNLFVTEQNRTKPFFCNFFSDRTEPKQPNLPNLPQDAHILVLELCEKGELFDLLYRGGPVPDVVCKEYFRQLMSGVKFCHGVFTVA